MRDSEAMSPLNERVEPAVAAGTMAVDETAGGMKRIKASVEGRGDQGHRARRQSDQIGAIVETIDDIAEQTNLLRSTPPSRRLEPANRARASPRRRRVRKLAERSSRATKEIADLIDESSRAPRQRPGNEYRRRRVETGAELAEQPPERCRRSGMPPPPQRRPRRHAGGRGGDPRPERGRRTGHRQHFRDRDRDQRRGRTNGLRRGHRGPSSNLSPPSARRTRPPRGGLRRHGTDVGPGRRVVASAAGLAEMAQGLDELVARFRLDDNEPAGSGNVIPRRRATDCKLPHVRPSRPSVRPDRAV